MTIHLIATTSMGFESMLKRELTQLGYDQLKVSDCKVEFQGSLKSICHTNTWLRTAGRVYIKLAEFKATTFDELFDQAHAIQWNDWIGPTDQFPVSKVSSKKSALFSKSDIQSIVKKAAVTQLKAAHNCQSLSEIGALCPIRVQIVKDIVTISLDTSGEGLNKRGYRAHMDKAPLRETLAAGLVMLSHYNPERDVVLDPFCGTGTLLIEAAMIACNMAPGRHRTFCSEQWRCIPSGLWKQVREEADDLVNLNAPCELLGSDQDGRVLTIARKNIELAGVKNVHVQTLPMQECRSRHTRGKIITNPPYGNRLDLDGDVDQLYRDMGRVFQSQFPDWKYYILSPSMHFFELFGQRATQHRKLFNGGTQCWFYQYY